MYMYTECRSVVGLCCSWYASKSIINFVQVHVLQLSTRSSSSSSSISISLIDNYVMIILYYFVIQCASSEYFIFS